MFAKEGSEKIPEDANNVFEERKKKLTCRLNVDAS